MGLTTYQLVQDFVHQQYLMIFTNCSTGPGTVYCTYLQNLDFMGPLVFSEKNTPED